MFGINTDKYDWQATESAPRNYPMQVVSGTLFYHGETNGLYVPNGSSIDHGWGTGGSSHVVGPDLKPLPDRLEITFFSYTENQFYIGKFDLPYDKIRAMFKAGYHNYDEDKHITYNATVVGVAPGGAVSVWLSGWGHTTEVFFGQAEKTDVDWRQIIDATHITREEFVQKVIKSSLKAPGALEAFRKNGVPFGLWSRYRAQYAWKPLFTGLQTESGRIDEIKYYNGEQDFFDYPLSATVAASTRPIPNYLRFTRARPPAKGLSVRLHFNEAEIIDAFKKLGANNQPLQLEMRIDVVEGKEVFTVWLRNDKDKIELKRLEIKTYNT